jgi:CheY-like chemotaxis protein
VLQAIEAADPAAKAKDVAVGVSLPGSPVVVFADRVRLRQIAWHLLSNAIKFTPRGGTVNVIVDVSDGEARLIVEDSGSGIDPQFLPRIFDRFTQADSSPTRSVGGLGVGLALVRALVELHGGEIEARNAGEGGAVFTVRLPLQSADLLTSRPLQHAPVSSGPSPVSLDGVRVLVLEEDFEGRELLRTVLEQRGATVRTVGGVAEALESLESWQPHVLLNDIGAEARGSYALVGRIRSLDAEHGGRIPAVALTTLGRTDTRFKKLLADVQREVPKPVEPAVLAEEIARLTGRGRRRA